MTVTVSMPQLGESVTEGTVTRWLKKEGERVEADEPLLEVSTDKVDTEIPSPASGILRGITVAEDETVAVGAQLAIIDDAADGGVAATDGQAQAAPAAPQVPQPGGPEPGGYPYAVAEPAPQEYAQPPAAYQAPAEPQYRPAVPGYSAPYGQAPESGYPAAAAETGYAAPPAESYPQPEAYAPPVAPPAAPVPPAPVPPAPAPQAVPVPPPAPEPAAAVPEPAGVPAPPAAPAPAPAAPVRAIVPSTLRGTTERLSRARQLIARRMVESLQTSAQLTTVVEADVTAITRLRRRAKADFEAREGVKLSFLPFFALAALEALKLHPKLNAVLNTDAGQIIYHDAEHLGIAVDTERGLMVPVIRNAGDLNIGGLARKIADLAGRTRAG